MAVVTVRLASELHERFTRYCEDNDISPSNALKRAVETLVDRLEDQAESVRQGRATPPPQVRTAQRIAGPVGSKPVGYAMDGSPIYRGADRLKVKKPAR